MYKKKFPNTAEALELLKVGGMISLEIEYTAVGGEVKKGKKERGLMASSVPRAALAVKILFRSYVELTSKLSHL